MEKQVVVEEPLEPDTCCLPCCCLPCASCCTKCCLPSCCKCPKCPGCHGCPGCSCLKRALCFVPRLLCYLPRKLLSCRHLSCLLITVVVVVLLVVIIVGALLMWLHVGQEHSDAVLRMGMEMWRGPGWEEDVATFYLDGEDGNPATVIYDYKNLLASYRSQLHPSCYITPLDKDNIPGLDTIAETFQRRQAEKTLTMPLADRSLLGTTTSILCATLPIYWA
ncbi:pulmonary surfactant-associated protein C-like [Dryobates pubescens]|uniref:pulmonary surfactant-associated protein C-like n=1 Tax=Dryobates pubescens TaxID=118200 RepID=UPI0023B8F1C3|nr:pulmonary surfactant-associated protein C-like [Dryobates pubescens]